MHVVYSSEPTSHFIINIHTLCFCLVSVLKDFPGETYGFVYLVRSRVIILSIFLSLWRFVSRNLLFVVTTFILSETLHQSDKRKVLLYIYRYLYPSPRTRG